ncbi:MAG: DJ-1/PfpI family protein [Tissierellia bacterium]|nr:DJ-1/PfpI family protein [Tissierellia bacterium]
MKDLIVFLANGFEEVEALTAVDFCRRAGMELDTVSIYSSKEVKGAHGVVVLADKKLSEINVDDYKGIFIPGGLPGAENLRDKSEVIMALRRFAEEDKLTAAICAGPGALDRAGLLKENAFTCYPGYEGNINTSGVQDEIVVKEGNVLTGMGPALAMDMAFALITHFKGEEKANEIKEDVLYPRLVQEWK